MITKKGQPAFGSLWVSRHPLHPPGDRSLGNVETQHKKLPVNARRSPSRILCHKAEDQLAHLLRLLSSANRPAHSGNQFPVQAEASPMPSDYGFWSNHDQYLFPFGPEPSRQNPEDLVEYCESRPGKPSIQCHELLAKSKVLKKQCPTSPEKTRDQTGEQADRVDHPMLLPHFACGRQPCILLKSQTGRVLANDNPEDERSR